MRKLLCSALFVQTLIFAQGVDKALLSKQPTTAWPTYYGDYSGRRYSGLNQITSANVHNLSLAWAARYTPGTGTGTIAIKSTPLMVDGVLYFTSPNHAFAVDARSGREIWHYVYPANTGSTIGNRGMAIYGNWGFFEVPDSNLVCIDIRTGKERWKVRIADPKLDYTSTAAPVIVGNHVIVGIGGDHLDNPGFLESHDPETGALQWKRFTTPRAGEPGIETWPDEYASAHGTGQTWIPGTYDPELNLFYVGTGNPNPVLAEQSRKGDNLYTCTILAINPDDGKIVWHYQVSPHDVHDWDATETPVLIDGVINGRPRKLLAQASRNGFYFLLDRATGEHLVTQPYIQGMNWYKGLNAKGQPIPDEAKYPRPDGTLVMPDEGGGTSWQAPSFSPDTGLLYVGTRRAWAMYYQTDTDDHPQGWGGLDANVGTEGGALQAMDYKTGKATWLHEWISGPGPAFMLTTAGNLLFTHNGANLIAFDAKGGKILWHTQLMANVSAGEITYLLDGKQYLVIAAGDSLYTFTVNQPAK